MSLAKRAHLAGTDIRQMVSQSTLRSMQSRTLNLASSKFLNQDVNVVRNHAYQKARAPSPALRLGSGKVSPSCTRVNLHERCKEKSLRPDQRAMSFTPEQSSYRPQKLRYAHSQARRDQRKEMPPMDA